MVILADFIAESKKKLDLGKICFKSLAFSVLTGRGKRPAVWAGTPAVIINRQRGNADEVHQAAKM